MRTLTIALFPALLGAQDPAQQARTASDEWLKQAASATDKFEAERPKIREKFDKNLATLDRAEKTFLGMARDELGASEANRMDPQAYARAAEGRAKLMSLEDSSAAQFIAGRRSGNPQRAANATVRRLADMQNYLAHTDTALKYAKESMKWAQRSLDNLKAEDKPGINPTQRAYIKRLIDYYEKADRVGRARAEFYGDYSDMFRKELRQWEKEIALLR